MQLAFGVGRVDTSTGEDSCEDVRFREKGDRAWNFIYAESPPGPTVIAKYNNPDIPGKTVLQIECENVTCADMFNAFLWTSSPGNPTWVRFPQSIGFYAITNPPTASNYHVWLTDQDNHFLYDFMEDENTAISYKIQLTKNGTTDFGPVFNFSSKPYPVCPSDLRTNKCT